MIQTIAFYLFAIMVVLSAGLVIILSRNPVHSVLWLILAFFNAAGLMLLVGAEFIAMLLVIVYVGAVAVLFLFVVMMLDVDFATACAPASRAICRSVWAIAVVLLSELLLVGIFRRMAGGASRAVVPTAIAPDPRRRSPISRRSGRCSTRDICSCSRRGAGPAGRDDRRDRADPPQAHRYPSSRTSAATEYARPTGSPRAMVSARRDRPGSEAVTVRIGRLLPLSPRSARSCS